MKKTLWALAFFTMLGCGDPKIPSDENDILRLWYCAAGTPKKIETNKELLKALNFNFRVEDEKTDDEKFGDEKAEGLDVLDYDLDKVNPELLNILDINNYWIDQSEQERRQQLVQELIPQIKEPIILWDLTKPNVAITIDDGYWVKSIEYMLDLFEKYNVKATFFVIWSCLKLHSKLWKRAAQQWHEICNHTAHHDKYFKTWNEPERFESELLWWEDAVKMVLWEDYFIEMKKNFPFFRFPWMYWIRVKAYLDILKKHGYIPIWWWYTENPKDGIVNNGDIFLWHFKDQDMGNVEKSLELILKNWKHPMKVSDIITTDWYTEPIWWHNLNKKRNEVKNGYKAEK